MMEHCKDVDCISQRYVTSVTDEQADAIYNDPWYGLINYENYGHW